MEQLENPYLYEETCVCVVKLNTHRDVIWFGMGSVFGVSPGKDHRAVLPGPLPPFPDLLHPCGEGQCVHGGGSLEEIGEGKPTQADMLNIVE